RGLIAFLMSLVLVASLFFIGVAVSIKRMVINPTFYADQIDQLDFSRTADELERAKVKPGASSQKGQLHSFSYMLPLVLKNFEAPLKKQTRALLILSADYFKGKSKTLELKYDLSALLQDSAFKNKLKEFLQKKADFLPDFLNNIAVDEAAELLPREFDLLKYAKFSRTNVEEAQAMTISLYKKFENYYMAALVVSSVLLIVLFFAIKSLRNYYFTLAVIFLLSGILLFTPYTYFDSFFKNLGGDLFTFLKEIGYVKLFAAAVKSAFLFSPLVCLGIAGVSLFLGLTKKEST
ncbi:MAG TPA: hypothetical protein PLY93_13385, partial [Turneriella sp.]|nr:hypothetical protein [Turneriella sp.]